MTRIRIENVAKAFAATRALDDVSLDLAGGSFTALLGASGCGKTTLLRLIAGFEQPDAGRILFDDQLVCDPKRMIQPEDRNIGVVFQSYALWPHLSVGQNVAYPLKMRGMSSTDIDARVAAALGLVNLGGLGGRDTSELSGGQRQRVALARCMVAEADVIVFDEPLANLDVHLRASMIESFRDVHRRTGRTIIYVTHDQTEALALADRVAVMDAGKVLQFSTPQDLYASPNSAAVAKFVGRGGVLTADVTPIDNHTSDVECRGYRFSARSADHPGGRAEILLRPEALRIADEGLAADVIRATYLGPVYEVEVAVSGGDRLVLDCRASPRIGTTVRIAVDDAWVVPSK